MYAGRKRRKPAQKRVKQAPAEGAKSNPSKRHRDRLNLELDRLASLLPFPEDVVSSLDKLSILRLSVSYLRNKSFFSVALKKQPSDAGTSSGDHHDNSRMTGSVDRRVPEGELLLQALDGFVLVVTADGIVFFCSQTIQDYLGFHQTDVMHQSVFELIHTEDQQEFRRNLHWALNLSDSPGPTTEPQPDGESQPTTSCLVTYDPEHLPPENSPLLERSFICRFRCLLDNSSGFLALNLQGRLKFLHGQNLQREGCSSPQLALFAIATPLQPPAILEIRTRNMIFRTKHKLDFTPMACDAKGKIVLGYTEAELRVRGTGYQFIHAADMLHCAENHMRMIKTGESGLTVFRLLTKEKRWKWVQANARLVYKNGKPDYIIATQRPLADEEGGEQLRKRSVHLPFTFATGEALLYHASYPLHGFTESCRGKAKGGKAGRAKLDKGLAEDQDPSSLLGAMMSQDESVYVCPPDTAPRISYHSSILSEQQDESEGSRNMTSDHNWNVVSNVEATRHNHKMFSYDPLLATLDSLSLKGEETCSNSELFSALENLGLNAEDLELLLLDERMIQVELDSNQVPTLGDLLTNNEILSYIQDSLQTGTKGEEQGCKDFFGLPAHLQNPDGSQQPQTCPSADTPSGQPLVEGHENPAELVKDQSWSLLTEEQIPPGSMVPNSHWPSSTVESHHQPNTYIYAHPQTAPKTSQLSGQHQHLHPLLGSSPHWQLQQLNGEWSLLPEYQNQLTGYKHTLFDQDAEVRPVNYNMVSMAHAGGTVVNSVIIPDLHYQRVLPANQPHQLQSHHKPQQHHLSPSCSSLDLEQLLTLSQTQHGLSSLETCDLFSTTDTQQTKNAKLENSFLLLGTNNTAYVRSCLSANGNAVNSGDIPVSHPDGLSGLQEPEKSGFFL
ncbi:aryl hydrocarbon receptor 1b [Thalassophryne amazonica]|uniref:aryl hydrocarbon receptor 1b n=1 Tax=Thalassophryne amazonica TaxID=390379 RepID=UPI001472219C|nr:aryl hydrocarbon receptor 1b [Thalassophryne amazonica]